MGLVIDPVPANTKKVAPTVREPEDPFQREVKRFIAAQSALDLAEFSLLGSISLPAATSVRITHGLGRTPKGIFLSPIRGSTTPGVITEISRDTNAITLQANGYGATISVDVSVF